MSASKSPTVSAVVCTKNSIASIKDCLESLRASEIQQIVVVDANSVDGTRDVSDELADLVLTDPGIGLGLARNTGISATTGQLVLNMGSDNVLPPGQLDLMINRLSLGEYSGVSARTIVVGRGYLARSLNAWRSSRFPPGSARIIGTPTLMLGDLVRLDPFSEDCVFSDDSELCERWARNHGAKFAISEAYVLEIGKVSLKEVWTRARMYGHSDAEVFRRGLKLHWSVLRMLESIMHPLRVDLMRPLRKMSLVEGVRTVPFLLTFVSMRYCGWITSIARMRSAH